MEALPQMFSEVLDQAEGLFMEPPMEPEKEETSNHYSTNGFTVTEETKIQGNVLINSDLLVKSMMKATWSELFPSMVKNSQFGPTTTWGEGNESSVDFATVFWCLSPAIPVHRIDNGLRLLRKCHGGWIVVDMGRGYDEVALCVQPVSDAQSIVTFMVKQNLSFDGISEDYKTLRKNAFGAKKWFSTLKRECERRAIHGFLFSPLLDGNGGDDSSKDMVRRSRMMREKFSSLITVKAFEGSTGGFSHGREGNLFSARLSVKIKWPLEQVFDTCRRMIMISTPSKEIENKIPPTAENNFVGTITSENSSALTLVEMYMDASEALLVHGENPSGYSIQPDGEGSYLTCGIVAEQKEVMAVGYKKWQTEAKETLQNDVGMIESICKLNFGFV